MDLYTKPWKNVCSSVF